MEALENSMAAFDLALQQGAQRFEFDVQVTKDGKALVIHDSDLKRTAQQKGRVAQMTEAELRSVKLKNGEPLPFLEDVIEKYKNKVEFNIELKGTDPRVAEATSEVLKNHKDIWEDVIVSSFKHRPLERMRELLPDVKLACLWGPDIEWPFFGNSSPEKFMNQIGTHIIHPWVGYVNDTLMGWARDNDWKVYAYSDRKSEEKNPENLWKVLSDFKIDGLCTNWPEKLKNWQEKR